MNTKLALSLLAAALFAAGCSKETPKTPAASAEAVEIRIGHVAPLTGGNARLGKDNENGARLAIEEANAANLKIGGKTAKLTLVAEADQEEPKVGATAAQPQSGCGVLRRHDVDCRTAHQARPGTRYESGLQLRRRRVRGRDGQARRRSDRGPALLAGRHSGPGGVEKIPRCVQEALQCRP